MRKHRILNTPICNVCSGYGFLKCSYCSGGFIAYCDHCNHGTVKCSACGGVVTRGGFSAKIFVALIIGFFWVGVTQIPVILFHQFLQATIVNQQTLVFAHRWTSSAGNIFGGVSSLVIVGFILLFGKLQFARLIIGTLALLFVTLFASIFIALFFAMSAR